MDKIHVIGIDDQQAPFLVIADPVFISLVEPFEIVRLILPLVVAPRDPECATRVGMLVRGRSTGLGLDLEDMVLKSWK